MNGKNLKIETGADGRTRYNGKTLAELPFGVSFPITISGLEDAELSLLMQDYRYGVRALTDEILKRKRLKRKTGGNK